DGAVPRPARNEAVGLPHHGAGFDGDVHSRRVRGRRREGRHLPTGGDGGRHGLHGGARGGAVSGARGDDGRSRGVNHRNRRRVVFVAPPHPRRCSGATSPHRGEVKRGRTILL